MRLISGGVFAIVGNQCAYAALLVLVRRSHAKPRVCENHMLNTPLLLHTQQQPLVLQEDQPGWTALHGVHSGAALFSYAL